MMATVYTSATSQQMMQVEPSRLVFIEPTVTSRETARLKGIFLQVNNTGANLQALESQILSTNPDRSVRYMVSVLQNETATSKEIELASMTLLRLGNASREAVLRFVLDAKTERQRWIADFLAYQMGFKTAEAKTA